MFFCVKGGQMNKKWIVWNRWMYFLIGLHSDENDFCNVGIMINLKHKYVQLENWCTSHFLAHLGPHVSIWWRACRKRFERGGKTWKMIGWTNFYHIPADQSDLLVWARGFLPALVVLLAACHCPVASHYAERLQTQSRVKWKSVVHREKSAALSFVPLFSVNAV